MISCRKTFRAAVSLLCLVSLGSAAQPAADYYMSFDDSLDSLQQGKTISPVSSRDTSFIQGVSGKALLLGKDGAGKNNGYVSYEVAPLFAEKSGTVMFWISLAGAELQRPVSYYNLMYAYTDSVETSEEKQRLRVFLNDELRCMFRQADGSDLSLKRVEIAGTWPNRDWHHIAFSWNEHGDEKLYVDGLPYQHGKESANEVRRQKPGSAFLDDAKALILGTPSGCRISQGGIAFDELKGFSRSLTDQEVSAEYRKVQPVDLIVKRRFLRAGESENIPLEVWPGGVLETPPTGIKVSTPVELGLTWSVLSEDGRVLKEKQSDLVLSHGEAISIGDLMLSEGSYRLVCEGHFGDADFRNTFLLEAYKQRSTPPVSSEPLQMGDVIAEIDCAKDDKGYVDDGQAKLVSSSLGAYREAGDGEAERFSYEVNFPNADGSPVVVEVTWPDDKPRSMGLYMFAHSPETRQHRDRLGGGIQGGVEYPCSGELQTVRYIFYPWLDRYLFEARTMIKGMPAAVKSVTVRPVVGRLPKLPILLPEGGLEQRYLGHMDEDQSFEILMNWKKDSPDGEKKKNSVAVIESLLDYFDYTGQNAISYPLIRYSYVYQDLPGAYDSAGFRTRGWPNLMLDMFERRGKKLIATCNLQGLPEDLLAPDELSQAYALYDRYGAVVKGRVGVNFNPVHPDGRRRFLRHLQDVLDSYGAHPAFAGIDLWFLKKITPWSFGSLDYGYGDFTVDLFEQESGIQLGLKADLPDRFSQRYELLTGKYRTEWLAWRARKTTELVAEIDKRMREVRSDLSLYLTLGGWGREETLDHVDEDQFDFEKLFYEDYGISLEQMAALPSVRLAPQRQPTWYRHQKHRRGAESTANELMWNPEKFAAVRATGKGASCSYLRYFESYGKSLDNDQYKSYFQSADVKPHGRYFLQELVQSVAATDPQSILIGGQPLGMSGRDAECREFARAFRALPVGPFADLPGQQDPVVVRFLKTEQGTWLYAANLSFFPMAGNVSFATAPATLVNLSTGSPVALSDRLLKLSLKPFELCSFKMDTGALPQQWTLNESPTVEKWYKDQLRGIRKLLAELDKSDRTDFEPLCERIQSALDQQQYAEAHRLIFCKRIQVLLPRIVEQNRKGYLHTKNEMIEIGRYAVNCGSGEFVQVGDTLFFPDRMYQSGGYGFDGTHRTTPRPVAKLYRQDLASIYGSEAYDIEAYRFTVPNGKYQVRLYLKHGYRPTAQPGTSAMSVDLEGQRVLDGLDIYSAAGGDYNQSLIYDYEDILVEDGVLDVEFCRAPEVDSTTRLCNAIEIIPAGK